MDAQGSRSWSARSARLEDAERAPTVLCYGHFDVQPPAPLDALGVAAVRARRSATAGSTRAASPTTRASSSCCSRRRSCSRRAASCRSTSASRCDGEEEIGRPLDRRLPRRRRARRRRLRRLRQRHARARRALRSTSRRAGSCYFHVQGPHRRARPPLRDVRRRRAQRDARTDADALRPLLAGPDGPLPEPLRAGIAPPTEDELAGWRTLQPGAGGARRRRARARSTRPPPRSSTSARGQSRPSTCTGSRAARAILQKTVLPVEAEANVSIRLAPGRTSTRSPRRSSGCCARRPRGAELEIERQASAPPGLVRPDAPAVQLGARRVRARARRAGRCSSGRAARSRSCRRSQTRESRP